MPLAFAAVRFRAIIDRLRRYLVQENLDPDLLEPALAHQAVDQHHLLFFFQ